jgi:hypothetical protein
MAGESAPSIYWIEGWMELWARLDIVTKRELPAPYWESDLGHPVYNQSLFWLNYPSQKFQ